MELFPRCGGELCLLCACSFAICLAGDGDDNFSPASIDDIVFRINENNPHINKHQKEYMINYLRNYYGYVYFE